MASGPIIVVEKNMKSSKLSLTLSNPKMTHCILRTRFLQGCWLPDFSLYGTPDQRLNNVATMLAVGDKKFKSLSEDFSTSVDRSFPDRPVTIMETL